MVALDARRLVAPSRLGDDHLDAAPGQVDRQREADRARADDDDVCSSTRIGPIARVQSSLTSAALMTLAHFCVSARR